MKRTYLHVYLKSRTAITFDYLSANTLKAMIDETNKSCIECGKGTVGTITAEHIFININQIETFFEEKEY